MDHNLILKTPTHKQVADAAPASVQGEWTAGYFKIKQLDLNLENLMASTLMAANTVKMRYPEDSVDSNGFKGTTKTFEKYNIFMFSAQPLWELFREISTFWQSTRTSNKIHYMQAWINVYEEGAESIGWHHHWPEHMQAWHGYYCLDVDVSKTTYALQPKYYKQSRDVADQYQGVLEHNDEYELIDVVGRDNMLVMGLSSNDLHRNIPWKIKNRPRITIAFDIVPGEFIDNRAWENHWIPLL